MIPSLNPSANLFLDGLSRIQSTITTATAQLSSGYRISQPSDAPDQISPLLQFQASLNHNQTTVSNLNRVQADVSSADQALSTAIQLLDQARSIGAQGASGTTTDATRANLAQQIQTIQEQMVGLANTQVAGRYVFGGDDDTTQPYAVDLNQPVTVPQNGVDRLFTPPSTATRQIESSGHSFITVDQTAQDLFDHRNASDDSLATDNVFAALNTLRVALQTPNNQTAITAAQTSLQTASSYLDSKETFYGNTQNRIAAAVSQINSENVNLQQQITNIRDTDVVQTALELTAAETQNQAAMAAEAKMPHTSLFDFLG
jgi:flagellar hook-associated protein 3 FlgL